MANLHFGLEEMLSVLFTIHLKRRQSSESFGKFCGKVRGVYD